jgi:cytochrome c oxidase subunit 1
MILAVGSIGTFIIGGVTGVFLAAIPIDLVYHDTQYVVGHFHFIIMGIIVMMMLAASYYWYPIITGRMYDQRLARLQAGLTILGVPLTFGSMLIMGALGLPRRYADYPAQFATLQQVSSVGAFIIGVGALLWLWNMVQSYRVGERVRDADVWDLKRDDAFTREWQWFEERLDERYGTEGERADD